MSGHNAWDEAGIEPKLEEVLSDPLVRLVIRGDGMTPDEVRGTLEEIRAKLRRTPPTPLSKP